MAIPSAYQTVDDLVASVVRGARLPQSQATFLATDLIAFLDEELKSSITDLIHSVREEYWLTNFDQPVLSNVFGYTMPPRAVMGGLRDVVFVDASGNEIQLAHLDPDQLKTPSFWGYRPSFPGQGFFVQNDSVQLWPTNYNNTAYTLRQKYERRPNTLTGTSNCLQVSGVNVAGGTVTSASLNTDWSTSTLLDIINNNPQFTSQGDNLPITNIVGTGPATFTVTGLPATTAIGMWLCPAGTTCIPQIPVELYPLLIQRGIMRVHLGMQNSNGFQVSAKTAEDLKQSALKMLTPRIEGSPKKIVNRNARWGLPGYPYFR